MAKQNTGNENPGFKHNQSANLVEEVRKRAQQEKHTRRAPNELGQQPLQDDTAPGRKRLSPQEQREQSRNEAGA